MISIHALRVEGDSVVFFIQPRQTSDFYPRPPGGGRRQQPGGQKTEAYISIHALRVEGDGD